MPKKKKRAQRRRPGWEQFAFEWPTELRAQLERAADKKDLDLSQALRRAARQWSQKVLGIESTAPDDDDE